MRQNQPEELNIYEWNAPQTLLNFVIEQADNMGSQPFRTSRNAQELREAWVVAQSALLLEKWWQIRMIPKDPPDAMVRLENFQDGLLEGSEQLDETEAKHLSWLNERINTKLKKSENYPKGTILLVYDNVLIFKTDCDTVERVSNEIEIAATAKSTNITGVLILHFMQGQPRLFGRTLLEKFQ